jgi:hypothetical protein
MMWQTASARERLRKSHGGHGMKAWMTGFAAAPDSTAGTPDRPAPLAQFFHWHIPVISQYLNRALFQRAAGSALDFELLSEYPDHTPSKRRSAQNLTQWQLSRLEIFPEMGR